MEKWNRCDACGKFIAFEDFDKGAKRKFITPDSYYSKETYETLCVKCNLKEQNDSPT